MSGSSAVKSVSGCLAICCSIFVSASVLVLKVCEVRSMNEAGAARFGDDLVDAKPVGRQRFGDLALRASLHVIEPDHAHLHLLVGQRYGRERSTSVL